MKGESMEIILSVLMLSIPAKAQTKWDWSQSVTYQENHDPGVIWLGDGRKLKVSFTDISWKTVAGWSKGRSLLLAYRPETGAVLFDPESGKAIPVLRGPEKHPIDILTDACVAQNSTTIGIGHCYVEGRGRWDREMNRAYEALMGTLNEAQKKAVKQSQRQWVKFRDSQFAAISAVNTRQGTIWSIIGAEQMLQVVREQAERLNNLYDPL